jgi:hypothetical protein
VAFAANGRAASFLEKVACHREMQPRLHKLLRLFTTIAHSMNIYSIVLWKFWKKKLKCAKERRSCGKCTTT